MRKASRVGYGLLVVSMIAVRAVRVKGPDYFEQNQEQTGLVELETASTIYEEPLKCPWKSPQKKDYYFDIPQFGDKLETIAVHLVRDPKDPKLIIYEGAIWTITQKVNKKQAVGEHEMVAVASDGSQAIGVTYDLGRDMVSWTKAFGHYEFAHTKCGATQSGPQRPERKSDGAGSIPAAKVAAEPTADIKAEDVAGVPKATAVVPAAAVPAVVVAESDKKVQPQKASLAKNSRGRRSTRGGDTDRGRRSSRGKRSTRGSRKSSRSRKTKSSFIEAGARILRSIDLVSSNNRQEPTPAANASSAEQVCKIFLAGGTYYQTQVLKKDVQRRVRKAHWQQVRFKASEVSQFRSVAPSVARALFGPVLVGALGYFAPLWVAVEQGVRFAPLFGGAAIGIAAVPAIILANSEIQHQGRISRMTATEILFEKIYCLSKVNSCKGHPCFKQCKDGNESLVLMPYDREAEGGTSCRCGRDLSLRC